MEDTFKVLAIAPKDIFVTFEMSLDNLRALITALECAELKYDGAEELNKKEAADYLMVFYKHLTDVRKRIESDMI